MTPDLIACTPEPISTGTSVATQTPVILDTNVMLDWLVFDDPFGLQVGAAVRGGQLAWWMTAAMRDEAEDVLGRLLTHPPLLRWGHRRDVAWAQIQSSSMLIETPEPLSPHRILSCSDPDDQCFIDLAVARRIPWLITRDRALLRLASRARAHGVSVLTPADWFAQASVADSSET